MTALETQLMRRLKLLPAERVAEVFDFVDFLATRVQRDAASARLADAMERLDALDMAPLSDDEIDGEVQEARRGRQAARQIGV